MIHPSPHSHSHSHPHPGYKPETGSRKLEAGKNGLWDCEAEI